MTEAFLIRILFDTVKYQCPHCGTINSFNKSTIDMFIDKGVEYIYCEDCNSKIKL